MTSSPPAEVQVPTPSAEKEKDAKRKRKKSFAKKAGRKHNSEGSNGNNADSPFKGREVVKSLIDGCTLSKVMDRLPLVPSSSSSIIADDPRSFWCDPLSIAIGHDGTKMPSSFHPYPSADYVQFSIRGAVGAYSIHFGIGCSEIFTASIYSIDDIYSIDGIYSTNS
ncbi:hypothetical protein COCNU_scaffold014671G000010 [Cocos nucifera]|nr:hypothetical protein [Cocos nucifera]